jgi:hypothetical protein
MRDRRIWLVVVCLFGSTLATSAEKNISIDCSKKSLADAVRDVTDLNAAVSFTGVCAGPIVVSIDGLTLRGVGTAVIDGGGEDAITIAGASRVSLIDIEVTNGQTGIVAREGAHVTLSGVNTHHNVRGLVADNAAGITVDTSTIINNTTRDIQLTFGTRADFRTTTFATYTCDATVLVRGTSGIVCPH